MMSLLYRILPTVFHNKAATMGLLLYSLLFLLLFCFSGMLVDNFLPFHVGPFFQIFSTFFVPAL